MREEDYVYNIEVEDNHNYFVEDVLVHNCHLCNPKGGMYEELINTYDKMKVVGLTATPYRLASGEAGPELRFITRTKPKIFNRVLYSIQNKVLFDAGYLAPLEYYSFNVINRKMLALNSTGADYDVAAMRKYYKQIDMPRHTIEYANRILKKRRNILVFCSLVEEAVDVCKGIPGAVYVTGETESSVRARLLADFKAGKIRCLVNVGVLTTGFDFPALEAVLMARCTMSLSLYYQIIGRVMRPFKYPDGSWKTGWFIDLGGNVHLFGKIETMEIKQDDRGLYSIWNNGRQLTNTPFLN